ASLNENQVSVWQRLPRIHSGTAWVSRQRGRRPELPFRGKVDAMAGSHEVRRAHIWSSRLLVADAPVVRFVPAHRSAQKVREVLRKKRAGDDPRMNARYGVLSVVVLAEVEQELKVILADFDVVAVPRNEVLPFIDQTNLIPSNPLDTNVV